MATAVVLGDGGHGRLISALTGAPCLGIDDPVPDDAEVYIGVGGPAIRRNMYLAFQGRVRGYPSILGASPFPACQVMPGAVIIPGAKLGVNVLVNTGAQIDHDCVIGDHCVIAPGAILCGNVTLGEGCSVGAGAIILQGVSLHAGTSVPAGTLVVGPRDFRRPQRIEVAGLAAFEGVPPGVAG